MNDISQPNQQSGAIGKLSEPEAAQMLDRSASFCDLPTPSLMLDKDKLERNLSRLAERLKGFGVALRPHMKTAKSAKVMHLALDGQPGGIVVQTLAEAEYFAANGCSDVLYAVSIVPSKLARIAELQARGVTVTIICDNLGSVRAIQEAASGLGTVFPVLIEIDADGTRSGIQIDDPDLKQIAIQLSRGPGTRLAGVLCHAGSAYDAKNRDELVRAAERERSAAVGAAELIRNAGLECPIVSVGSTPSASSGESFGGVTEVRAGVYMFQDLSLVELGTCDRSDIAMTVLASVIAHNRRASTIMIDAGALALSKDLGFTERSEPHYGELIDAVTEEPLGLVVNGMSQEHGIITAREDDFDRLPIGSLVRILPNHACITAAGFDHYAVVEQGQVTGMWERCTGW